MMRDGRGRVRSMRFELLPCPPVFLLVKEETSFDRLCD